MVMAHPEKCRGLYLNLSPELVGTKVAQDIFQCIQGKIDSFNSVAVVGSTMETSSIFVGATAETIMALVHGLKFQQFTASWTDGFRRDSSYPSAGLGRPTQIQACPYRLQ